MKKIVFQSSFRYSGQKSNNKSGWGYTTLYVSRNLWTSTTHVRMSRQITVTYVLYMNWVADIHHRLTHLHFGQVNAAGPMLTSATTDYFWINSQKKGMKQQDGNWKQDNYCGSPSPGHQYFFGNLLWELLVISLSTRETGGVCYH